MSVIGATPQTRLAVLMFTDVVGSTHLKSKLGVEGYVVLLRRHDELFKAALADAPGCEVLQDTGDGYFVAFTSVSDAVRCALRFQHALHQEKSHAPATLRVRIGIHLGQLAVIEGDDHAKVIGLAADIASRLTSLAQGGQILLSRVVFDEARQFVRQHPAATSENGMALRWVAHGNYLFKGADDAMEVFEVGVEGAAPLSPPANTEKARRSVTLEQTETLGWRPAVGLEVPQRPNWRLERKLGEGTFGEVWLASHQKLKQQRVFKFCFDADRLHSFKRELTFFRLLRDVLGERRDIARLYDVRLDTPPFFLESEFAPGGNLIDWAEAHGGLERIRLEMRVEIVAKVGDAVAAAHSVGILHKDIKPGNILIHPDVDGKPQPQLADFGIGLLHDRTQLRARNITESGFTMIGDERSSRTGTQMYAPPESLAGKPYTTQGDIYALGVLLYQMVVGDLSRPLAEGWGREVEDEFLRDDIAQCVDGNPARRFASATDLAKRLRALPERAMQRDLDRRFAGAAARRKHLLRAAGVFAAACLLIAIISVAGYFRERTLRSALSESEANARKSEHTAQIRQLENLMTAGDSLSQSRRYAEAVAAYTEAWDLADSLSQPTIGPISGLLQARGAGPPAIIGRRPTSRPGDKVSPLARVRVAPSGEFLVAGDGGGHAFVMDLALSRVVATLPLKGWGYGIAFGGGGKICLVGSYDGELQAWDVGHWDRRRGAVRTGAPIYCMAAAADGKTVACAGPHGTISLWLVDSLKKATRWKSPVGVVGVAISPDGKTLAAGGENGSLQLWDIATTSVIRSFDGHSAEVVGIAFTPDGRKILSGSYDKTVRLWDVASGKELHTFAEHRGSVHDVAISHDGRLGASASGDETVICWDLESGKEVARYSRHPKGALSVDFLPDDSATVSSGETGALTVRPLAGDDAPVFKLHTARISGLCICPDGLTALSASWDRSVKQFDLASGRVLRSVTTPQAAWSIAVSADGRSALIGGAKGMLQTLDLASFTLREVDAAKFGQVLPSTRSASLPTTLAAPARYQDAIGAVAISPDRSQLLAGGNDQMFSIVPVAGNAAGRTWRAGGRVFAGAFLPDARHAVIAVERDLLLIDLASGERHRISTPTKPITSLAVSPGGKIAAAGSYDETVRLWDLDSRMNTKSLLGHLGWVRAVAYLPDGKTLVSASEDETVRLWDVATGSQIRCFGGHTAGVCALAVSPDGTTILSGSDDATIRKWDLSRPIRYRALVTPLGNLYSALDANADDPAALKKLGEWYAFRSRNDWAIQCLERARAGGATVSPLLMARCYWKLDRSADAAREFRRALSGKEAPADYLELCLSAVTTATTTAPATAPR